MLLDNTLQAAVKSEKTDAKIWSVKIYGQRSAEGPASCGDSANSFLRAELHV